MVKIFTKFVKDTIEDMDETENEVNNNKEEEMNETVDKEKEETGRRSKCENLEEISEMLQDIDRVEEMVNEVLRNLEHK